MRIDRPKRGRRGAKRLDLSDMKDALKDRRVWNALGVVTVPEDGGDHFTFVHDAGGALVDILVEVSLMPDGADVSARMSGFGGGAGRGFWTVPAPGDEVVVALPAGRYDFQPAIVAVLSSRDIPNPSGQGPAPGRVVIVCAAGEQVMIHDGGGGAGAVALAAELNDFRESYLRHGHTVPIIGAAGTTPTTIALPAGAPPLAPPHALPSTAYPGTTVLKAK